MGSMIVTSGSVVGTGGEVSLEAFTGIRVVRGGSMTTGVEFEGVIGSTRGVVGGVVVFKSDAVLFSLYSNLFTYLRGGSLQTFCSQIIVEH